MPKVRHTILLLAILIVPFVMKMLFGYDFEAYPAIILPSGPHVKTLENEAFIHNQMQLFVQEDGEPWIEVDAVALLHPYPEQYSGPILRRQFGLIPSRTYPDRRFINILSSLNLIHQRVLDEKEIRELHLWIIAKLEDYGIKANRIKIASIEKKIDLQGNVLDKSIADEQIIDLY